jgi:hypothetical protein
MSARHSGMRVLEQDGFWAGRSLWKLRNAEFETAGAQRRSPQIVRSALSVGTGTERVDIDQLHCSIGIFFIPDIARYEYITYRPWRPGGPQGSGW